MMVRNMGSVDRIIRFIAALVIWVLYAAEVITGWPAIVLRIVAMILLVTSILGYCPLYALFKLSTRGKSA